MSNFVVGIGGSGAKLMQALIHLGAAGMMPAGRAGLTGLLVDPDESNGNVLECNSLQKAYQSCKDQLQVGKKTDLLAADIALTGPWTPLADKEVDTLKSIFHYNQLSNTDSADAQLMDLFFERQELDLSVKQGFRGRPAIGAAVFANSVDFEKTDVWRNFRTRIKNTGGAAPHVLFAGSVFGGSGASGVPTLARLLSNHMKDVTNIRYGLTLFLPFFQFQQVEGEAVQADPASFPMAAAEALKYYDDQNFLKTCHSIYSAGEEVPAEMSVSAVGAREQRNDAHFIELVAGMGAIRFFNDKVQCEEGSLAVAARNHDSTLTWDDLPTDKGMKKPEILKLQAKLQKMAVFAVAYHYIFYPEIQEALGSPEGATKGYWQDLIVRKDVKPTEAQAPLAAMDTYAVKFLEWLLHISTPRRAGFSPGLVNPNVFGTAQGRDWRLKLARDFHPHDIKDLLLNRAKSSIDYRTIDNRASRANIKDDDAAGPGLLVRALYDACAVD